MKYNPQLLVDSSTSYHRYKLIADSLEATERWKKWRLSSGGEEAGTNFFSICKIGECDSCNQLLPSATEKEKEFQTKYFFKLKGFTIKNDAGFLIEKDKYLISYTSWDKQSENGPAGHAELKETKVRFSSDLKPFQKNETALLIPITKTAYQFWKIFTWVIFTPLLLVLVWICFILPFKVLYRIAMGNCFTEKNVKNLRLAGWGLIFTTFLPIIISLLVTLFMGSALPEEIYFPTWLIVNDNKGWLIGGIAFLIVANAFEQGMKLQQEQELTV